MSCPRCTAKHELSVDPGHHDYRTNLKTELHPDAPCDDVSYTSGATHACNRHAGRRRPLRGENGIGDATLIHRSYRSSGDVRQPEDTFVDTWSNPMMSPHDPAFIPHHTRGTPTTYGSLNEAPGYAERALQLGNHQYEGYRGVTATGGHRSARMEAAQEANAKYEQHKSAPMSATSYGSYGVPR